MKDKDNYIKSPVIYWGSKYRILDQLLPLFPSNIKTFVDLFGGAYNVGINVQAESYVYNDILTPMVNLIKYFKSNSIDQILYEIDSLMKQYGLSEINKESYMQLRADYNKGLFGDHSEVAFYVLSTASFSNLIRFNKKGEFNLPFGYRIFNVNAMSNLTKFNQKLREQNLTIYNKDYKELINTFDESCFIYVDPPYYDSDATYTAKNLWGLKEEEELYNLLDNLNEQGIKWAVSNNLSYNNKIRDEWMIKYAVSELNIIYKQSGAKKKEKQKTNKEILIMNY